MVDSIIEIPRNSRVKYEIDKTTNLVRVDRILSTPMVYPFNYGFIPNTLSSDGDPLDVILLIEDDIDNSQLMENINKHFIPICKKVKLSL